MLRLIVEGTSLSFGEDYFLSLARHLASALAVRCAFVCELHPQQEGRLRLLACWDENDCTENFEYDVQGTPCEHVIEKGLAYFSDNVQQLFPDDQWLVDNDVESYLAIPLLDLDGKPIGLIGIAHDQPLPDPTDAQSILQVSSMRASAELLRMRAGQALHQAHGELELRVKHRTADLEEANRQLKEASTERKWMTRIYRDSPIGLCCLDKQLRYIDVNEQLAALNGIPIEDHLGWTISEVLPDVAAGAEMQLRQVIETGEPIVNGEVVAATPANPHVKRHFLYSCHPLKSNTGEIVGVSCAIQDVTERKRAEAALKTAKAELEDRVNNRTADLEEAIKRLNQEIEARRTSKELLLAAQNAAKVVVWEFDISTSEGVCSDEYYRIHGRQPDDSVHTLEQQLEWIHPDDQTGVLEFIQHAVDTDVSFESEYRVIWPNGTAHWLVCKGKIVRDGGGTSVRILGATYGITERKRVEHALRASEDQVRSLLDSTVEAIYGLDLQGNCTFCNRACVETLGYDRTEELLGQNMHDLIHHTRPDGSHYPVHECRIYEAFRLGGHISRYHRAETR